LSGGRAGGGRGALAIVLHTHMPYVEGFGTWPFGEEWLWEAIAGSYLPLLPLLGRGAPVTLSLTPVLCDQLEADGVGGRFRAFVEDVRRETHRDDAAGLRAAGEERLAAELDRSWEDYAGALEQLESVGGDLLGALGAHAGWTSSATHAVLPLLATGAALREQVRGGVRSHERRFGEGWAGGFWLPECAHDPALEPALLEAGASAACVELTSRFGLGAREHLQPVLAESGLLLAPVDRETMSLVWSPQGYPAAGCYRDYHHHTVHHHNPWDNAGGAYDHEAALALAREHAADFVARTQARLREHGAGLPGGGLAVCALDTELLGHWWYEGIAWLEAVVEECSRQGLALVRLDDALAASEPATPTGQGEWGPSSWGEGGDLSTWSGPAVAEIAFAARAAELDVLRAGAGAGRAAVRAMLALQASDWAFMVTRGIAAPYALERHGAHLEMVARALAGGQAQVEGELRNLAADADPAGFLAPA
jgi:1,4-alpha-glucan branching enzyme